MLTACQGIDAQSAGNTPIPFLKAGGNNLFVVNRSLEQEYLPVCSLCSPPYTVGKVGLDISVLERILRNHMHSKQKHPMLFGNIGCQLLSFKIGWHNCSVKQYWVVNPMLLTTLVDCRHRWVTTLGFYPTLMTTLGCKFY